MKIIYRLGVICLLLFATIGLCVGYAEADRWTYPGTDELASTPDSYEGHQTLVFGEVVAIDHVDRELRIVTGADPVIELTVENVPTAITDSVEPGAAIQVYGFLGEGSRILVADEIVVDYRDTTDSLYAYGTSILGWLLAVGSFLWYWRPDVRRVRFVPRGGR